MRSEAGLVKKVSGVGFQVSSFKSPSFPLCKKGDEKGIFPDSRPETRVESERSDAF
jgi:hypothetical protein